MKASDALSVEPLAAALPTPMPLCIIARAPPDACSAMARIESALCRAWGVPGSSPRRLPASVDAASASYMCTCGDVHTRCTMSRAHAAVSQVQGGTTSPISSCCVVSSMSIMVHRRSSACMTARSTVGGRCSTGTRSARRSAADHPEPSMTPSICCAWTVVADMEASRWAC